MTIRERIYRGDDGMNSWGQALSKMGQNALIIPFIYLVTTLSRAYSVRDPGLLAPHAPPRRLIVAPRPKPSANPTEEDGPPSAPLNERARLKRLFAIDSRRGPRCEGEGCVVAVVTEPVVRAWSRQHLNRRGPAPLNGTMASRPR